MLAATFQAADQAANASRPLVLVVDDEPMMRSVMMATLREHYRVVASADGQDAFATFGVMGEPIAVVVTDIRMPRMNGLELAEAIGRMPAPPPVLFVSGFPGGPGEMPGPFLTKPFQPDALVQAVSELLSPAC